MKRIDPIAACFERYIALSAEQQKIFHAQVMGYGWRTGAVSASEPRKAGRPPGSRNKAKTQVNGAAEPEGATP